jgi:hypothetical protein
MLESDAAGAGGKPCRPARFHAAALQVFEQVFQAEANRTMSDLVRRNLPLRDELIHEALARIQHFGRVVYRQELHDFSRLFLVSE